MTTVERDRPLVHREIVPAFTAMREAAREAGFDLTVASGYRSFDRQRIIWNEKATGKRTLLSASEEPLIASALSPQELVFAILRWSALPGASRHHWGSDIDVYDRAALPEGAPKLRYDETIEGAIFHPMHVWLDENLERFGFYRPYDRDRGGVSPEPWHLSHTALGPRLEAAYSLALLKRTVRGAELALAVAVLESLEEIYDRFVMNVAQP